MHVPDGACVATDGHIGLGEVESPERARRTASASTSTTRRRTSPAGPQLLVTADIGVGQLQIDQFDSCA